MNTPELSQLVYLTPVQKQILDFIDDGNANEIPLFKDLQEINASHLFHPDRDCFNKKAQEQYFSAWYLAKLCGERYLEKKS